MGLEKAIRELGGTLLQFSNSVGELRLAAVVDRPEKNDAVVVDKLEYAVEDLRGWLNEASQAARLAELAAGHPMDLNKARLALTVCQDRFRRIDQVFAGDLASYDRLKDLANFVRQRRGEWPSWATSVRQGIDQCRTPLDDARAKLAECWQEIAERAGMTSISVSATSIGPRMFGSAPAPDAGEGEPV